MYVCPCPFQIFKIDPVLFNLVKTRQSVDQKIQVMLKFSVELLSCYGQKNVTAIEVSRSELYYGHSGVPVSKMLQF